MDCAFLIYQSKNDAFAGTALLEVAGHGEDGPYLLTQLLLVRFKLAGWLTLGGVLLVKGKLSSLPHPILALNDTILTPTPQVDLIQPRLLAHLHDLGSKVAQSGVGAAVLGSGLGIAGTISI